MAATDMYFPQLGVQPLTLILALAFHQNTPFLELYVALRHRVPLRRFEFFNSNSVVD